MAGCAGLAAREIFYEIGRARKGVSGADAAPGMESALIVVDRRIALPRTGSRLDAVAGAHPPQEPLGHGDPGPGRPALEVDARADAADSHRVAHRLRTAAGTPEAAAPCGLVDAEGPSVAPHDDPRRDRAITGEGRDVVYVLAVAAPCMAICAPRDHGDIIDLVFRFLGRVVGGIGLQNMLLLGIAFPCASEFKNAEYVKH